MVARDLEWGHAGQLGERAAPRPGHPAPARDLPPPCARGSGWVGGPLPLLREKGCLALFNAINEVVTKRLFEEVFPPPPPDAPAQSPVVLRVERGRGEDVGEPTKPVGPGLAALATPGSPSVGRAASWGPCCPEEGLPGW